MKSVILLKSAPGVLSHKSPLVIKSIKSNQIPQTVLCDIFCRPFREYAVPYVAYCVALKDLTAN